MMDLSVIQILYVNAVRGCQAGCKVFSVQIYEIVCCKGCADRLSVLTASVKDILIEETRVNSCSRKAVS